MTLANLDTNEKRRIKRLLGNSPIKSRLITMGFFTGATVSILQKSFGNVVIRIGSSTVGVSSNLLEIIELEDNNE